MLDFGRELCGDLAAAGAREWLVTNGIGGYATGTVAGVLARCYHGLLIAAISPPGELAGLPPAARTLLVAKLDETVVYDGDRFPLFANRWRRKVRAATRLPAAEVEPQGFRHLERFHLHEGVPTWTFACADTQLEKRVWMEPGVNTTYVRYTLRRGSRPLTLQLQALVNYRDHHGNTACGADWPQPMRVDAVARGLRVTALPEATPFYLLGEGVRFSPRGRWREGFFLSVENYRGLPDVEAHLHVADLQVDLAPGQSATIVLTTEPATDLDGDAALARRQAHQAALIDRADRRLTAAPVPRALVAAADQFIVSRTLPDGTEGRSIIAGYPWFGDWGRDTMISLPGLTLVTGRHDVARRILRTFARYVDRGMLPNRFPDAGETPEYNTVDATLWFFEAIRAYVAATGDLDLVRELYPVLEDIVDWHRRGTRYRIHVDAADGLIYAGEAGVQLTWMDAKVGDWVVTPRIGKPVEINALWYNALGSLADLATRLGRPVQAAGYRDLAERARAGFARFWNEERGYCFDVLDGPDGGDDPTLRPNQLLAVSLPHSPLDAVRQRAVVDACARHLVTSHGLRSLAPEDPAFIGHYGGDRRTRDAAYHQGTVWGWLIGPFVSAHYRVYRDREAARSFLRPLLQHLNGHCVGSLSEIFDGDPPHTPRGCIAQAWTVAEVLRAWQETL